MSKYKDEELAILHKVGIDSEYIENTLSFYWDGYSLLRAISGRDILLKYCSCVQLEKCMLELINICDDVHLCISLAAGYLGDSSKYACVTERTLRKMLEVCGPDPGHIFVLGAAVTADYRARQKSAIKCLLESGLCIPELKCGLKYVRREYIEHLVVYDMIFEALD